RSSEGSRNVLVHTSIRRDVVGAKWNVRTMVHEYGTSPAMVHVGVVYFSHLADGQIY
ncbi:hypothetical protein B0H34DRAFT_639518, partial [Crassisporium funariophilum]